MSFFEALLYCYLLFSTTSAISLLSRTSSIIRRFLVFWQPEHGIHSSQRQREMWSTELYVFFPGLPPTLHFANSLEVKWIPRHLNVREDCISKLVGFDDYTSRVLILLTSSPVATTSSCLDLTIRFFQVKIVVTTTTTGLRVIFCKIRTSTWHGASSIWLIFGM